MDFEASICFLFHKNSLFGRITPNLVFKKCLNNMVNDMSTNKYFKSNMTNALMLVYTGFGDLLLLQIQILQLRIVVGDGPIGNQFYTSL